MFPDRPVTIPDDPHNMGYQITSDPMWAFNMPNMSMNAQQPLGSGGMNHSPWLDLTRHLRPQSPQQPPPVPPQMPPMPTQMPQQPPPSFGPNQMLAMQMAGYPGPSGVRQQQQMNVMPAGLNPGIQEPGPGDRPRNLLEDLMRTPGMFNTEELIRTVLSQPGVTQPGVSTPFQPPGATGGGGSFTGPGGVIPVGPFQMFDPNRMFPGPSYQGR